MHQDHGNSPKTCKSAIEQGFTTRHDGRLARRGRQVARRATNTTCRSLAEVVKSPTARRVGRRRARLPRLARKRRGRTRKTATAPGQAGPRPAADRPGPGRGFVRKTGVDALAVAIGTSHGAYKFTRKPTGEVLAMDRIIEIHKRLPNCHMVMHGSQLRARRNCCDIINKYGGKMKQTWGVPVEEIQRGIKHGVRKINVDTDNRMAITGADPQGVRREARRVRPARLPEAGARAHAESMQGPHDPVRPGRTCSEGPVVSLDDMAKAYLAGKFGAAAKPDEKSEQFKGKK